MKTLKAFVLAIAIATTAQANAAGQCADLFAQNDELKFMELVTGKEKLTLKESYEFLRAAHENQIPLRKLYEEFSEIMRFSTSDLALVVTHSGAIRVATAAIINKIDWPRVRATLENLIVNIRVYQLSPDGSERRAQTPHRVVFALAELSFRTDYTTGQLIAIYNANVKVARESKPTQEEMLLGMKPMADRALEITIEQVTRN